jgi:hypothetical protein
MYNFKIAPLSLLLSNVTTYRTTWKTDNAETKSSYLPLTRLGKHWTLLSHGFSKFPFAYYVCAYNQGDQMTLRKNSPRCGPTHILSKL